MITSHRKQVYSTSEPNSSAGRSVQTLEICSVWSEFSRRLSHRPYYISP